MSEGNIEQKSNQRIRIQDVDSPEMRQFINIAYHLWEPEDSTQRQAFSRLMPDLYAMRNKGFSFSQITKLLKQCGFNLQIGTVRTYYSEMLSGRLDECQKRMNEQILLMAQVKKKSELDATTINATESMILALKKSRIDSSLVANKLDQKLSGLGIMTQVKIPSPSTPTPQVEKPNKPFESDEPAIPYVSDFGLTVNAENKPSTTVVNKSKSAGFFDLDAPVIPNLAKFDNSKTTNAQIDTQSIPTLKCLPIKSDVESIGKRDRVPNEVYELGLLEHPAIKGLILTKEQRLYGAHLEYVETNNSGEIKVETPNERRFRVKWQTPIPPTIYPTSANFIAMDNTLFNPHG